MVSYQIRRQPFSLPSQQLQIIVDQSLDSTNVDPQVPIHEGRARCFIVSAWCLAASYCLHIVSIDCTFGTFRVKPLYNMKPAITLLILPNKSKIVALRLPLPFNSLCDTNRVVVKTIMNVVKGWLGWPSFVVIQGCTFKHWGIRIN